MHKIKTVILAFVAALMLAGCGGQKWDNPSLAPSLSDGNPVPTALGEAIALGMNLSMGTTLQEARDFGFSSEAVYDLSGKPLNNLILVGPKRPGFWETITNLAGVPDDTFTAYGVGATDKRVFFSVILPQSYLKNLAAVRTKAGSFKRLLSAGAGSLYLESAEGIVWDVNSGEITEPNELAQQRKDQAALFAIRATDGVMDGIKGDWDKLIAMASKKGLTQRDFPPLADATLPNGHLDITKVLNTLSVQRSKAGIQSVRPTNEHAWCMGWFCAGMGYASAVRKNANQDYNRDNPEADLWLKIEMQSGDSLGNTQSITSQRSAPSDGYWGAWDFGNAGIQALNLIGCGPGAITRLFGWYGNQRAQYGVGPNNTIRSNINLVNGSNSAPNITNNFGSGVAYEMWAPVELGTVGTQKVYQPRMSKYTDTWHIQGSGFTRDTNMVPGANTYISNHADAEGKMWELRGSSKAFVNVVYAGSAWSIVGLPISWIDFSQHTWRVRSIAREKIGRDNEPVIAMYGPAPDKGHFAMSQAYIVHEGWFSANVLLWIGSYGGDILGPMFVNVTDMGSYFSGAFGLYRK